MLKSSRIQTIARFDEIYAISANNGADNYSLLDNGAINSGVSVR
jgi:hypothetical protein